MLAAPEEERGLQFKKIQTLKKSREFEVLYREGVSWHGKSFIFFFLHDKEHKVGFIVSKKVGCAVVRNKIRRRLREVYRFALPQMKKGRVVLIAKYPIVHCSYQEIVNDFFVLARNVGALSASQKRLTLIK